MIARRERDGTHTHIDVGLPGGGGPQLERDVKRTHIDVVGLADTRTHTDVGFPGWRDGTRIQMYIWLPGGGRTVHVPILM